MTPKVGIEIKPASLELPDLNFEDSFEFLSTRTHRSTSRLSSNAEADPPEPQAEAEDNYNYNSNNSPSAASEDKHSPSFLTAAPSPKITTAAVPSNPSKLESRKPAVRVDTTPSAAAVGDDDEFGGANIEELLPTGTATPAATTSESVSTTTNTRRSTDRTPASEKSPETHASQTATSSIQLPPEAQDGDDYLPSFLSSSSTSRPRSRRARTARASSTKSFSFDQSSVHSEPTPRAIPDPFAFLDSPSRSSTTAAERRQYFATSRAASVGDQQDSGDDSGRSNSSLAKTAPAGSFGLATIHEHSSTDLAATAPVPQPRAKPIVGAFITSAADELQSPVREKPQVQAQAEQEPRPQYRPRTAPSLTTAATISASAAAKIEEQAGISPTPLQVAREAERAVVPSPDRHRRHQSEPAPAWLFSETSNNTENEPAAAPQRAFSSPTAAAQSPQRQPQSFVASAVENTAALSAALAEQKVLSEQLAELRQACDKLLREKAETLQAQEKEQIRLKVEQDNALAKQQQLHEQAMLTLQEQHKAVVEALKRVHEDEMATLKTHAQDAQVLDSLAHQIKMSAGTLKLLETQVSAGYRGLDATREGQLEARERLLRDMEASAKDMQKQAESEGYKLNGYLQSMEHLLRSLRSQHVEERERLRLEHLRLEDLQQAIRAESEENRRQLEEERFAVQEKAKALAAERRDWLVERDMWRREFQSKEAAFERTKEEFARGSAQTSKQLEETKKQQEEERIKLERQRRQLEEDIAAFERAKAAAAHQLEIAAKVQAELALKESEVMKERVRLSKFAEDVHALSNQVTERSMLAEQQIVAARQAEELAQKQLLQLRAREEQLRVSDQALQSLARKLESDRLSLVQQKTEALRARAPLFGVASSSTAATMSGFQRPSCSSTPFTQPELTRASSTTTILRSQHELPLSSSAVSLHPSMSATPLNDYSSGGDDQLKLTTSYLQSVKIDLQR